MSPRRREENGSPLSFYFAYLCESSFYLSNRVQNIRVHRVQSIPPLTMFSYVSLQLFRIRLLQIQLKTFKSLIPGGDRTEARSRPVITTLSNTLACTCMVENGHEEHPASDQTQIQYWVTAALFPTAKM